MATNVVLVEILAATNVNVSCPVTVATVYVPLGGVPVVRPATTIEVPTTSPCSRRFTVTTVFGLAVALELADMIGLPFGYHSKAC